MEEEQKNKFSAEYIRKYLDGQLSDQEMQVLEKAALEDPFLSDAIEGFEESRKHSVSFESGIAELKTRLTERVRQRKRNTGALFQLSKWQVAASFILVIGIAVFATFQINKKPVISQSAPGPDTTSAAIIKPPPENKNRNDSIKTNEPAIASASPQKAGKTDFNKKEKVLIQKDENTSVQNNGKTSASTPSGVTADSSAETEKRGALVKRNVIVSPSVSKEGILVEKYSEPDIKPIAGQTENYIKGVIVDDKGKPIPLAEVNIKGSNQRVFTDTSGFFKLYMKDPRLAALVFSPPAIYESVSAELKPDSNMTNTIQFHSSSVTLNKVVLLQYNPSFVIGWDAFYNYIDNNKKINTADSVLKGDEIVSFLLHPDGKLSSFKIEKSVSRAHDTEILRLIQMAPELKSQDKKKKRYRLQIRFK
jgi:hypothetical protein